MEGGQEELYVNPVDPPSEEQMQQQEKEDDADLAELKQKLQRLSAEQPPDDEAALIEHLKKRLEYQEQAIVTAEEVISHERMNRKAVSRELRERSDELRVLVNSEKRKLQDKVHDELERTLQQALKEKMAAEEELASIRSVMEERNMLVQELDDIIYKFKDENAAGEQTSTMQQKVIQNLEEALQSETELKQKYLRELEEKTQQVDRLRADLQEAHGVVVKLEEARVSLNRLLGPNGVISEYERTKYLSHIPAPGLEELERGSQEGKRTLDLSSKMLAQNNQYFYEQQPKASQQAYNNDYGTGGGAGTAALLDEANEDDFWYQAPKGQAVAASGEYLGYVDTMNNNQGNSRVGSRRSKK